MGYSARTIAAILCISIGTQPGYAQKDVVDSLRSILPRLSVAEQGAIHYSLGDELSATAPDSAIFHYNKALSFSRQTNNDTLAGRCLTKIGIIRLNAGAYEQAIRNLYQALKIFQQYDDKYRAVRCLQYLAIAYNEQGMYDQSLDFARQSLELSIAIGDKPSAAVSLGSIGSVYYSLSDYDHALEYFLRALHTMEEIDDQEGIADALNNVAEAYERKQMPQKALRFHLRSLALARAFSESRTIAPRYHNIGRVYKSLQMYPVAIRYLDSSIALAREGNDRYYLKESYDQLSELYSTTGDFEKAYETHLLFSRLSDTLMSEENKRQFAEMNAKYETERKDNQISLLQKDGAIRDEQMHRQRTLRNGFIGGFAIVLLFAGVLFSQRNRIRKEKQRSDELLLNILPSETADELKATGEAQAKQFEEVTVMFTDFKNFTQASEKLSAAELVKEIHRCYSEFDRIISRHNLEKIKTIGDSYMCAGGLPVPNKTNAEDTIRAALEISAFISRQQQEHEAAGKPSFEIRIGCHTGPVVAGIVGVKKFAYDIWGDTVNIASRMESSGEAGKINISGTTFGLIKDKFRCTYRGKVPAKNKGEIDMYFVDA